MTNPSTVSTSRTQARTNLNQPYTWHQSPDTLIQRMEHRLNTMLLGKSQTITSMLICLLAGGHLLIEDVPGVGKSMLATTIAKLMGGKFHRIQFTSDLMPSDIVGGMILDPQGRGLVYREGPIMANVILADELNRASTRTQSALLEALEHHSVSVEGITYRLPEPFVFIATQNPISYEGTNTLLEAQLDRFMMQLSIGYPTIEAEQELLTQYASLQRPQPQELRPIVTHEEWMQMQRELQGVFVHSDLIAYMTEVAAKTREDEAISIGISPRALRDWLRTAQASAYVQGRGFILPDDLLQHGVAVLSHRIQFSSYRQAPRQAPMQKQQYITNLLQQVPLARTIKERVR